MSKKKAFIYIRLELPKAPVNEEEPPVPEGKPAPCPYIEQTRKIRDYALRNNIEILETHVEPQEGGFKKYGAMLLNTKGKPKSQLPDFILLESLHALTRTSIVDIFGRLSSPVNHGINVISVEDDFVVNIENFDNLISAFKIFDATDKRVKREKINLGIYKRRLKSPDGKVHARGKTGGNYRKTNKDEIVKELREAGKTLHQIAEQEEMSVGRVRNILNALKQKQLENLSSTPLLKSPEPNDMI
jgi:DNA-binding CsgD family transcriptional regulator